MFPGECPITPSEQRTFRFTFQISKLEKKSSSVLQNFSTLPPPKKISCAYTTEPVYENVLLFKQRNIYKKKKNFVQLIYDNVL